MVAPLRLVTLETVKLPPGRQSISVTGPSALRLHAQKAVVASESEAMPRPITEFNFVTGGSDGTRTHLLRDRQVRN